MAAFSIIVIVAASLLAPFTMAAPAYTHTATEIDWVTVEETVTVWLDPASATSPPVVVAETTTAVATTTTTPAVMAQATYTTPSSVETAVAATPTVAVSSSAAVVPSSPSPVASSTSSAAAAASSAVSASSISASTSADCEGEGDACVGDVTHWDGGLGACGWSVDTNSDLEIALPYEFMGTLSNTNPYCGRSVTLYNPTSGTTVQATVGDKCMGCVDRAIDCTDALFTAITDGTGDGRVSGIEWWLN
ncbi:hypothetical protein EDD37DRAFT_85198 [Exophiala viscosa]|uniref:RlpA-like protein double-psi beta-barrel domain-containing protein n=1 Tax=Exophiala viscosa TaxID=2486360 RepID=A0AAN6E427_9EURO|nr:hypothetical protein EDD36DRAFT_131212 [Exophiala viscosa]KAI1630180.1 hypothetical protein EDD37DRAFT_85198 [Exophiala viscosa]